MPRRTLRIGASVGAMCGAALATGMLSSCGPNPPDHVSCSGDFGASVEARRLESFLHAAADFHAAAADTEADLRVTCHDTGVALDMSEAEIFAGDPDHEGTVGLRSACTNVAARIEQEIRAIRAAGAVVVTLDARAPSCDVSLDAYASCVAECEAIVDPGSIDLVCDGGELRGTCDAQCTGSCAVDVDIACAGRCEGLCDGACSVRGAHGECAGSCDGVCHGQCVVSSTASCTGECRGSCSVEFTEPRCTGDIDAPMASIDCTADCDARVAAMVTCTPGEVRLAIDGTLDADLRARADRLIAAIEVGAAGILELRLRAGILSTSASVLVSTASSAPSDAAAISAGAVVCATGAALDVASAARSLAVSVDVSVSVSATISATAD